MREPQARNGSRLIILNRYYIPCVPSRLGTEFAALTDCSVPGIVKRVWPELIWLLRPDFAGVLIWCDTFENVERFGEVVGHE